MRCSVRCDVIRTRLVARMKIKVSPARYINWKVTSTPRIACRNCFGTGKDGFVKCKKCRRCGLVKKVNSK